MKYEGVIEIERDRFKVVRRVRHRRTATLNNSTWARFACSERGEGIAFPFDDELAPLCLECWPVDPKEIKQ